MGITQKTEAVGMYSAEGEYVEFGHSVLLEGPVEVCTSNILTNLNEK
jgi:dynein heavy chain